MSINGPSVMAAAVVAVDVGKSKAMLSVSDAARHRLLGPVEFVMTASAKRRQTMSNVVRTNAQVSRRFGQHQAGQAPRLLHVEEVIDAARRVEQHETLGDRGRMKER
jgi:hypothetical protein